MSSLLFHFFFRTESIDARSLLLQIPPRKSVELRTAPLEFSPRNDRLTSTFSRLFTVNEGLIRQNKTVRERVQRLPGNLIGCTREEQFVQ